MNDTIAGPELYERFGFYAAGVQLPPVVSHLMGYFGDAPAFGFYSDDALDRVMMVSKDGVEICGNAGIFALIVHRIGFMRPDLVETFGAKWGDDANLSILIEPGRTDKVYLGTEESLFKFFGVQKPTIQSAPPRVPAPTVVVKRGDEDDCVSFNLTNAEYIAYKSMANWFSDLDGKKRQF